MERAIPFCLNQSQKIEPAFVSECIENVCVKHVTETLDNRATDHAGSDEYSQTKGKLNLFQLKLKVFQ